VRRRDAGAHPAPRGPLTRGRDAEEELTAASAAATTPPIALPKEQPAIAWAGLRLLALTMHETMTEETST
jgi:hypothetical protein